MAKKKSKEKTPEQLVIEIQEACRMLGWNVAFNEGEPGVRGLIIGQDQWVSDLIEELKDDYSVYTSTDDAKKDVH